ncbi:hypothetical protein Pve01_27810 [Planomonospora venezuelensis]|nr:hypothetical protein Pve01_27810 [Planomonospora venezuelensis]
MAPAAGLSPHPLPPTAGVIEVAWRPVVSGDVRRVLTHIWTHRTISLTGGVFYPDRSGSAAVVVLAGRDRRGGAESSGEAFSSHFNV